MCASESVSQSVNEHSFIASGGPALKARPTDRAVAHDAGRLLLPAAPAMVQAAPRHHQVSVGGAHVDGCTLVVPKIVSCD